MLKNKDSSCIYELLEKSSSLVECCNNFKSYNKNKLHLLSAPEYLLTYFYKYVNISADAEIVASLYMKSFGDVVICREASYNNEKLSTIMDVLDDKEQCSWEINKFLPKYLLFKIAFNKHKFKRAKDCNWDELCKLYCNDPFYRNEMPVVLTKFVNCYKNDIINNFSKLSLDCNKNRKRKLSDAYDKEVKQLTKHKHTC